MSRKLNFVPCQAVKQCLKVKYLKIHRLRTYVRFRQVTRHDRLNAEPEEFGLGVNLSRRTIKAAVFAGAASHGDKLLVVGFLLRQKRLRADFGWRMADRLGQCHPG